MSDKAANHRNAADRHEAAAHDHERAAAFWEDQGDAERAALQQEMAEYERLGATLERRWAELVDRDAHNGATRAAELVRRHARQGAKQISVSLTQLAKTLERSARIAEEHAERLERAGRRDGAQERQAASDARELAQRARAQAEQWLKRLAEQRTYGETAVHLDPPAAVPRGCC